MKAVASIAVRLLAIVPVAFSGFAAPDETPAAFGAPDSHHGLLAQEPALLDGKPVLVIANDKLTLSVRTQGGSMVRLVLNEDPDKVNPMHVSLGHFVCVDGFGPVSPEERQAGLPGHGEAHRVPWEVVSSGKKNGITTVAFSAALPIVQEAFRRTLHMVDGESVVYVESELENLLGFDRPINWGEHGTIGPPFLELGKTVVEMSAMRAMTRSPRAAVGKAAPARVIQGIHVACGAGPERGADRCAARPGNHAGRGSYDVADGSIATAGLPDGVPSRQAASARVRLSEGGVPLDAAVGVVSRGRPVGARAGVCDSAVRRVAA